MSTRLTLALSLSLLAGLAPLTHALPTAPAAAAPAAAEDWAWLAPFADDSTLGAIVVDLARVDLAAIGELMNAAAAESAPGAGPDTTKAIATWRDSIVNAGASQFVVVFTLKDPGGAPAYIIVRPRADADPKALLAHIEAPAKDGGMDGFGLNRSASITSGCILVASEKQREGLGTAERAAVMTQALTLAGDAPIRIAMFPADFARRAITEIMPRFPEALGGGETRPIADAMVACGASLSITSEPTSQMRIAAFLSPLIRVLLIVTSPISWPVAKLLDCWLGHEGEATDDADEVGSSSLLRAYSAPIPRRRSWNDSALSRGGSLRTASTRLLPNVADDVSGRVAAADGV
jgi:hypothetical protein